MPMFRPLTALMFVCLSGAAFAADPIFVPGSRIGLVPPPDMKVAPSLPGFRDAAAGSAIAFIEMPPEAYPSISAGFSDEALKAQKFVVRTRETEKIGDSDAVLLMGDQTDGGRTVPKMVLLVAEKAMTALIIGQLPPGATPDAQAKIEAALKSVVFRPPLSMADQVASLPFRFGDLAGFRAVRVMPGNSVLLTEGSSDSITNADQPILIVAQSLVPAPAPDQRDAFARSVLVSNTFLKDTVLERSQSFRQDGADWQEIVAKATDGMSGQPVVVMQTIHFEENGYLRMVGVVRAHDRDKVMPQFRRIVDSVKAK